MIRNKLILAYLLPMALLLGVVGLMVYMQSKANLEEELGRQLEAVSKTAVAGLASGDPRRISKLGAQDKATIKRFRDKLDAVRVATGVRRVFVVDHQLRSLVDTRDDLSFGDELFELQLDRVEMERVLTPPGRSASSMLFTGEGGVRYKNGYTPIVYEGETVAVLGVEGSAEFFEVINRFQALMLALGLLSLLVVVLVSVLVARSINQPIEVLESAARRFGRGDLTTDVQMARTDEFQTLAHSFNEMRQGLLDRDRQMQMMLSGIAHEVRNPLGGMELFCGLLKEELEELGDKPQLEGYVGKVAQELRYLKRVVNDFLNYARRNTVEVTRFSASTFVGDVVQMMRFDMESWEVALTQDAIDEGLDMTGDKEMLHRVMLNLIRNAGQASKPGGCVRVGCRRLSLAAISEIPEVADYAEHVFMPPSEGGRAEGYTALTIVDEGEGIAPASLESIFEAFFTTREKGSGLGLALTTKVVEEHGGGLLVASTFDKSGSAEKKRPGTMMAVILPFNDEIEAAKMQIPEGWLG